MKTLIGIIAAAALTVTAPLATARDFRSADIHPDDYPTVEAVRYMGKLLDERERRQAQRQGLPERRARHREGHHRAAQDRRARHDAHQRRAAEQHRARDHRAGAALPVPLDTEHMRKVLDGPIGDEILAAMEPQGLVGLAFYDSGARSIYTVKKPIKTLADMKGLKIRVQQSDLWVGMMRGDAAPTRRRCRTARSTRR